MILAGAAATAAAPGLAAPSQSATVKASVVKPLSISWIQDLSLGDIVMKPGSWSGATIAISRTGTFSCTNANVTCSGVRTVAQYKVVGSNNQAIQISAPNVTLVNQTDSSKTLVMTVDKPASLTLPNSGQPGTILSLGGSITISSTTAAGNYAGTFNVTVDY